MDDAMRTLTDADVEAITAPILHALGKTPRPKRQPKPDIEYVQPRANDVPMDERRMRYQAAVSNVSPENQAHQNIPGPLLRALVKRWHSDRRVRDV